MERLERRIAELTELVQELKTQTITAIESRETDRREKDKAEMLRNRNRNKLDNLVFEGTEHRGEFEQFLEKVKWQQSVLELKTDTKK